LPSDDVGGHVGDGHGHRPPHGEHGSEVGEAERKTVDGAAAVRLILGRHGVEELAHRHLLNLGDHGPPVRGGALADLEEMLRVAFLRGLARLPGEAAVGAVLDPPDRPGLIETPHHSASSQCHNQRTMPATMNPTTRTRIVQPRLERSRRRNLFKVGLGSR
jgi:hypothetical protein